MIFFLEKVIYDGCNNNVVFYSWISHQNIIVAKIDLDDHLNVSKLICLIKRLRRLANFAVIIYI